MRSTLELGKILEVKRAELHGIFEKGKSDQIDPETGIAIFDLKADDLLEINKREEELAVIDKEYADCRAVEIYQRNLKGAQSLMQTENKLPAMQATNAGQQALDRMSGKGATLTELLSSTTEYKGRSVRQGRFSVEMSTVDMKTLMSETGSGFTPPNPRGPIVIPSAQRKPVVADLIPQDSTNNTVIRWMEETTFTNNSAGVLEGGTKPEGALAFTERTQTVEKIAQTLPVTEEQVDDIPQLRNVIDNRLMLMLMQTEELQLLSGTGTDPQLTGFLTKSGVQTQARGADPQHDAIFKAFTLIRWTGFAEPTGIIMHPNDYQTIRLMRTADGLYIYGPPSEVGAMSLWGKPIIVTTAITQGTSLTGDFTAYSHISRRMGVRVDVSDSHLDFFATNKLLIRIEERLSLEIYRAGAFCKVTGM